MIQKQPRYFHISVQIAHVISRRFRVICCEGIRRSKSCRPLTFSTMSVSNPVLLLSTSKCMHGMNQTEAEYSRQYLRVSEYLSQIGPVVLEV